MALGEGSPRAISVLIPAYNAEGTLLQTLHSVQRLTFINLEVLIVDDGSNDAHRGSPPSFG